MISSITSREIVVIFFIASLGQRRENEDGQQELYTVPNVIKIGGVDNAFGKDR